jgi:hypothetical protein
MKERTQSEAECYRPESAEPEREGEPELFDAPARAEIAPIDAPLRAAQ